MKYTLKLILLLLVACNLFAQQQAAKPLFRDPIYDGAADPVVIYHKKEKTWLMFYTNRRASINDSTGVAWVHGTPIGVAASKDGGATWQYRDTVRIDYKVGNDTYWAPEIIEHKGLYHIYLTHVPGIFKNWNAPRAILHLTSKNLMDWHYESTLKLASDKVIDAAVFRLPNKKWGMWYNNERDKKSTYYAESDDLYHWTEKGKAIGDRGEGPKVFRWKDKYWLINDPWKGLGVYSSDDLVTWNKQANTILGEAGTGLDDGVIGGHADVVVNHDKAYIFYFTHPGRTKGKEKLGGFEQRRSSIQVAELQYKDSEITCDRNAPTYIKLTQ
jgi:beta-xylosidase